MRHLGGVMDITPSPWGGGVNPPKYKQPVAYIEFPKIVSGGCLYFCYFYVVLMKIFLYHPVSGGGGQQKTHFKIKKLCNFHTVEMVSHI